MLCATPRSSVQMPRKLRSRKRESCLGKPASCSKSLATSIHTHQQTIRRKNSSHLSTFDAFLQIFVLQLCIEHLLQIVQQVWFHLDEACREKHIESVVSLTSCTFRSIMRTNMYGLSSRSTTTDSVHSEQRDPSERRRRRTFELLHSNGRHAC